MNLRLGDVLMGFFRIHAKPVTIQRLIKGSFSGPFHLSFSVCHDRFLYIREYKWRHSPASVRHQLPLSQSSYRKCPRWANQTACNSADPVPRSRLLPGATTGTADDS